MAIPGRPGAGTTLRLSKASKPENPIGTWFANPIRASSLYRLRQQAGQTTATDRSSMRQFVLATREPSTEVGRLPAPNRSPDMQWCSQAGCPSLHMPPRAWSGCAATAGGGGPLRCRMGLRLARSFPVERFQQREVRKGRIAREGSHRHPSRCRHQSRARRIGVCQGLGVTSGLACSPASGALPASAACAFRALSALLPAVGIPGP